MQIKERGSLSPHIFIYLKLPVIVWGRQKQFREISIFCCLCFLSSPRRQPAKEIYWVKNDETILSLSH